MGKNKLDVEDTREEKTINTKRKRALRNRERLMNHKAKLLDNFAMGVKMGYSEENWNILARLYAQISDFLSPTERHWLGELWRDTYASEISPTKIEETVSLIKTRLSEPASRYNMY